MRKFHIAIIVVLSILMLGACERTPKITYIPNVTTEFVCLGHEQQIELKYTLQESVQGAYEEASITSLSEWITVTDTSTHGVAMLHLDKNEGDLRQGSVILKAPGHKNTTIKVVQYGQSPEVAEHTLMFYFFGTSLSRYFNTNLEDAIKAIDKGILSNNNRVVFLIQDEAHKAHIGEIRHIEYTNKVDLITIDNLTIDGALITPEVIGKNIARMAELAPAKRYGIIFAGHGQGWIPREALNGSSGVSTFGTTYNIWTPDPCAEVTRAFGEANVQVNTPELAEGIEMSNIDIDYLLFDACFMANIETIYDLRDAANYIIASPCEIMGRGFPYERTLPYLFEDGGKSTNYEKAAESYYLYYRDEYVGSARCGSIAVFDCSELDALATTTAEVISHGMAEYDHTLLQTYEGQNPHFFYDFGQWTRVISTNISETQKFDEQLKKTVIAKYSLESFYSAYGHYGTYPIDLRTYSGVTTSAPSEAYPTYWQQTNWYKDVVALEN